MLAALRRGSLSERVTTSINALGGGDDEALESLANDFLVGSVSPGAYPKFCSLELIKSERFPKIERHGLVADHVETRLEEGLGDGVVGGIGCGYGDKIEFVFASTLTSALALGKTFEEALLWAPINSMAVVQEIGAQKGLLTRAQIEEHLAKAPESYKLEAL